LASADLRKPTAETNEAALPEAFPTVYRSPASGKVARVVAGALFSKLLVERLDGASANRKKSLPDPGSSDARAN
jgi:hypothetical protein